MDAFNLDKSLTFKRPLVLASLSRNANLHQRAGSDGGPKYDVAHVGSLIEFEPVATPALHVLVSHECRHAADLVPFVSHLGFRAFKFRTSTSTRNIKISANMAGLPGLRAGAIRSPGTRITFVIVRDDRIGRLRPVPEKPRIAVPFVI